MRTDPLRQTLAKLEPAHAARAFAGGPGQPRELSLGSEGRSSSVMRLEGAVTPDLHVCPAVMTAVNERSRTETARCDNQTFTGDLLNSLTDHVVVLDQQGAIIAVNEAWLCFARWFRLRATPIGGGRAGVVVSHHGISEPENNVAATPLEFATGELPRGRGQRILIVDDERMLLQISKQALDALGYVVDITTDSAEALDWVRAEPQRFALVLTDQTMPGMTGLVLAARLQLIRPGLPIILTTGSMAAVTPGLIKTAGIRQVLPKPATLHALATAVQAALQPPAINRAMRVRPHSSHT